MKNKNCFALKSGQDVHLQSTITCPKCKFQKEETMSTTSCQVMYKCQQCNTQLKPKEGDCCVYCSYGDKKCPSKQ